LFDSVFVDMQILPEVLHEVDAADDVLARFFGGDFEVDEDEDDQED
jgi:hypothetical protein